MNFLAKRLDFKNKAEEKKFLIDLHIDNSLD